MVAWWIRASTFVFGNSILAIRLPALLTHFIIFYELGLLSPQKKVLFLLLLTPLSLFGALLMTPDIPFLFFWFFYFKWTLKCDETLATWSGDPVSRVYQPQPLSLWDWGKGGIWLGLGLLSKYTMALAPFCSLLVFFTKYRFRSWMRGFLLHSVLAGLFFLPVVLFNVRNDWAPFWFQWNHQKLPVQSSFVFTFLGNQILILGALPFLLIPWILLSFRTLSRVPTFRVSTIFFLVPMAFFLFKSTHHFLEANWALAAYLSFWILAAYFFDLCSIRALKWFTLALGFVVPIAVSLLLSIHLIRPLPFLKIHQDRLGKMKAQKDLVLSLRNSLGDRVQFPFFLPTYQWTAYFNYWVSPQSHQLIQTGRPSHFTLNPKDPCQFSEIYFFKSSGMELPASLSCFKKVEKIGDHSLVVRGVELEKFDLLELSGGNQTP